MTAGRALAGDLIAGLSLANLFMLRAWFVAGGTGYFAAGLAVSWSHAGLVADWLILGMLLAGLSAWSRRGRRALRVSAVIVGALLLVPLDWVLRHGTGVILADVVGIAPWLFACAAVVIVAGVGWIQFILVRIVPIVALPVIPVTVWFAFAPLFASPPSIRVERAVAPRGDGARVLWLVFDELEQRILEGGRPDAPPLPAFARLMSEAFVAGNAEATGAKTVMSIPAMFTGRAVTLASPAGSDLILRFGDGGSGRWSEQPSAVRDVRGRGFATGVAGWFHPYCSVLADQWDTCVWMPMDAPENGLAKGMHRHAHEAISGLSLLARNGLAEVLLTAPQQEARRAEHARALRVIAREGEALARRMDAGLALVHYPIPHLPPVAGLIPPAGGPRQDNGYYANAVLADRVLASLRHVLEASPAWDRTVIVVTSDHGWRTAPLRDDRVPLIVRFPAGRPLTHAPAVSLLVLRDLLPRLVSREIATGEQLARYLDDVAAR